MFLEQKQGRSGKKMPLPVCVGIRREGVWMVRELKQQSCGIYVDVGVNVPWSACSRMRARSWGARCGRRKSAAASDEGEDREPPSP